MSRTARVRPLLILGLLLSGSWASAKGHARKGKPAVALVEVEAKLLEYEQAHFWCTYPKGASAHGLGESPWGRFRVTAPANHVGRAFGVLLKCSDRPELQRALRTGVGGVFVLFLPQDFLDGKFSEIEDCVIDSTAMKRWRAADAAPGAR